MVDAGAGIGAQSVPTQPDARADAVLVEDLYSAILEGSAGLRKPVDVCHACMSEINQPVSVDGASCTYHIDRVMADETPNNVHRFNPAPTRHQLEERVKRLALDTANLKHDHPHMRERMEERDISMRQVLQVIRNGSAEEDPARDQYGSWRLRMRMRVAGRRVSVVVAVHGDVVHLVTTY